MKSRGTNTSGVILWVVVNRVLGRIFGLKRNEVIGIRRKLHNEEFQNLCSSPSIIRTESWRMRWIGNVVRIGEKRVEYILWVGKLWRAVPKSRK
jgi:hypothetical protein